jgi:hypothetical protein
MASFLLSIGLVQAKSVKITDVYYPSKARPGDGFTVFVALEYETDQNLDETILIQDTDKNVKVGEAKWSIGVKQGMVHTGEGEAYTDIVVPSQAERAPPYTWKLRAQVDSSSKDFQIEIINSDSDSYLKILSVVCYLNPYTPSKSETDHLYEGDLAEITAQVEYSTPEDGQLLFKYRESREETWRSSSENPSETKKGSASIFFAIDVVTPFEFVEKWSWDFQASLVTKSGKETDDSYNWSIQVLERTEEWAAIAEPASDSPAALVLPTVKFNILALGHYFLPNEEKKALEIRILKASDSNLLATHVTPELTGHGVWSETISLTAPGAEGEWDLRAEVKISGESKLLDQVDFPVIVTKKAPSDMGYYCEITDVIHPNEVTYGQDFTVTAKLHYNLLKDPNSQCDTWILDAEIAGQTPWDMSSDTIKGGGTGTSDLTLKIPGTDIPPRNGPWNLLAMASYRIVQQGLGSVPQITPDKYKMSFQVNVVGAKGPQGAGGMVDWSFADAQIAPFQSVQGDQTVFQAVIQANPVPNEPKQVQVVCRLDGKEFFNGYVTYEKGMSFLSVSSQPWTATLGAHTLQWEVDPNKEYNDPNRNNNHKGPLQFTVTQTYTPPSPPSGQPPPKPGEEFDFYVTANPTEQTLSSSTTFSVQVNLVSGSPQPVQLELMGAPADVSSSFTPSSGAPNYTSTLTLTAAAGLPAGTYPLTIKASAGGKERYKPLSLVVEQGPSYSLSITPDSAQVNMTGTTQFHVDVSSGTGYEQYVNLMVSGIPEGVSWKLDHQSSTPPFQATLTLQLSESATPGVYELMVAGSGPDPKSATATLIIAGPAAGAEATQPAQQGEDVLVNYLAAGFLVLIIAAVVGGGVLAFRRLRVRRVKAFCIECGARLKPGSEFCPDCGAKQPTREGGG